MDSSLKRDLHVMTMGYHIQGVPGANSRARSRNISDLAYARLSHFKYLMDSVAAFQAEFFKPAREFAPGTYKGATMKRSHSHIGLDEHRKIERWLAAGLGQSVAIQALECDRIQFRKKLDKANVTSLVERDQPLRRLPAQQ